MERRRVVRVPASSANLGPGYDVMAAALSLFLELEVTETGTFEVRCDGLEVSTGRDNLVVRAFELLHPADGISFRIGGEVPLARGLGSSAAAIVAGLMAADHLFELGNGPDDLFELGARLEGHPDNVAAAVHGGIVLCGPQGGVTKLDVPEGLEALLVVPISSVATDDARAAIPDSIPTADAIANLGATAQLVAAICRGDLGLIGQGLADAIHQPRRRELFPKSMEVVDAAAGIGALGATISGAGPSVLVWTTWQDAGNVVGELEKMAEGWAEVLRVPFSPYGAHVPEL